MSSHITPINLHQPITHGPSHYYADVASHSVIMLFVRGLNPETLSFGPPVKRTTPQLTPSNPDY